MQVCLKSSHINLQPHFSSDFSDKMVGRQKKAKVDMDKLYNGWKLIMKLDEGGFGQVFKAVKDGQMAALKAESNYVVGGSAIKLELTVLTILNKKFEGIPHFPYIFHAAKRRDFSYMVVTLLGKNVRSLKSSRKGKKTLSVSTWARIGLQALYCIKLLHDAGYVHRDIKPANFMFGRDDDPERARLLHILDFGLARSYIREENGKIIARRARPTVDFRGTLRYCSPNVHFGVEQSRRDDLWSMFYMIIELHCGLPWQHVTDKTAIDKMKLIDDDILVKALPYEVRPILKHLHELELYNRPDYSMIANCFKTLCDHLKVNFGTPYDWETEENAHLGKQLYKEKNMKVLYEDSDAFFASDPIKINGPPVKEVGDEESNGSRQEKRDRREKVKKSKISKMGDDESSPVESESKSNTNQNAVQRRTENNTEQSEIETQSAATSRGRFM